MPTPKLFKKFSSKSSASESSPAPDVPADDKKDDSPYPVAATVDSPVPEFSESLTEAWTAAHQEQPLAKGAEKFLNKIGMSIIRTSVHDPPPSGDRRRVSSIQR